MLTPHIITGYRGESRIFLGESLARLTTHINHRPCLIVTDEEVYPLYQEQFPPECPVVVIGTGEAIKTLDTLNIIYQHCLDADFDRAALLVAIGGGIVCDIAGFAASTYLRGIHFGFVPTTLLAQVDASVGGKNGVNFHGYKNLIGTFTQPEFVLIDVQVLTTLPPRALGCGIAEAIKHGAIADLALFEFMEQHVADIRQLQPGAIERIVHDSIVIKSSIVNQDEQEHGERRKLNFGHTFGHGIEKTLKLPHGEAVSLGMAVAAQLSQQRGYISENDVQRFLALLTAYDLPVTVDVEGTALKTALRKDKKRYGDMLKFVLLTEIGQAIIENVSLEELEMVINRW